jgi:hypothetical protein
MTCLRFMMAVLCAATTLPAAVDPALLDLVMPDVKVLAGIQVQQSLASPFGRYFLTQIPSNDGMLKFAAATGFDLRRDLRDVVVASISGTIGPANTRPGLILARGTFQPERFIALATISGASVTPEGGVVIMTPPQNPFGLALAFLDSSTVVIGDRDSLKGAIARHSAHAVFTGPLAQKAQAASAANDAWFTTLTPLSQFVGAAAPPWPEALLQSVVDVSAGIHFDASAVTLSGEVATPSDKDAQSMADTLKFLATMVQANKGQNPQAAQAAALLENAQFSASGPVMRMSLSVPEQQMEQIFVSGAKPRKIALR